MKTGKLTLAASVITGIYNNRISRSDIFVVLVLVINIIANLLIFFIYKSISPLYSFKFIHSLVLGIAAISPALLVIIIIKKRRGAITKEERKKTAIHKMMVRLETKALRAQMNPHFIFNCMNSIKALIQQDDNHKAVSYLTTFSKLLRALLENSDNPEISLFEEVETCKIYTELESMRFHNKIAYNFSLDKAIDLKSVKVPALILQPFIENAIWHGLMPKGGGTLNVLIFLKENKIHCVIEDDGIGRRVSMQNKLNMPGSSHQSKGMKLTQSRLELNNSLNRRDTTVQIIDKANDQDEPTGTTVVLMFDEE